MTMTHAILGNMETLGPLIRSTRERRGIRATDLAHAIGKDPSYLSKLERDLLKEIPPPDVIVALSKELSLPELRLVKALGFLATEQGDSNATGDPRLAEIAALFPVIDDDLLTVLRWIAEDRKKASTRNVQMSRTG